MKTLLTSLIAVGVCLYQPIRAQSRFSVGVMASPSYTYSNVEGVFPSNTSPGTYVPYTSVSHWWSYTLGLVGYYHVTPKWSVSAGVWADRQLTSTVKSWLDGALYLNPWTVREPSPFRFSTPIQVHFKPSSKRLSPYVSAGVLLAYRSKTTLADSAGNVIEVYFGSGKPIVVNPMLGVGVNYDVNRHSSLVLQPTFLLDVQPSRSERHIYTWRLQAQWLYRF